jgi:hypothetical protein
LFFKDLEQDLAHPLYPEVAIIWTADGPQLLAISRLPVQKAIRTPTRAQLREVPAF